MALTQLGPVDLDLDQATAVSAIEQAPEDDEIFAFDVHLVGTVVPVVAQGAEEAQKLRRKVLAELDGADTFAGGGYVLDLEAVQAVGAMTELAGLDELHPDEASFDVFLDGTVVELFYDTPGEAATARDELIDAVNDADDGDDDEEDEE
ncbi:MAG: hypothetical protein AAGM22_04470 [Acidobacteriota bacterium]